MTVGSLTGARGWPALAALASMTGSLILLLVTAATGAYAQVSAVRVWPAPDSTRITFESPKPIEFRVFTLRDPDRLVLELDAVDISPGLSRLAASIPQSDPLIRQARVGRFKPGVLRVVFDLKAEVAPQAFALKPVGEFAHRIVLDLFPANALDPVAAFLERQRIAGLASAPAPATLPAPPPRPNAVEPSSPPAPTAGGRQVVVAIDPGHGGEDPGAIGPSGVREKDVVLAIGRRLARLVDATPGMRAHLIRDGDYFIPLHQRVSRARALKADLFVSIHADAWFYATARGSSVYALSLSGATSAAARWLATRENEADRVGGVNLNVADPILKQTLLDLSQTATIDESLRLGRSVLSELGGVNRLHRKQVEQAGFAVLKAPDIPSILVETAFITNPDEERRLVDETHQERIAQAILDGIRKHLARTPVLHRPR